LANRKPVWTEPHSGSLGLTEELDFSPRQDYTIIILCAINRREPWAVKQKPSIDDLARLLNSEEDKPIQILPNGEIREIGQASAAEMGTKKPLTMKENLGGEYRGE